MRKLKICLTLIALFIIWRAWIDYSLNRKDFLITDLTKPKHLNYVTGGRSFERILVTIDGEFDGTIKMAFFYGGEKQNPKNWTTMTFKDSIHISWPYEEGRGAKHEFYFIPVNARSGSVKIRIRNGDTFFKN